MQSPYTIGEQETIINMFPSGVSDKAYVYTCIPNVMNRLRKLCEDYPDQVAIMDGTDHIDATVPREWIKIAPKRRCTLSDEQKRANAERLAAYRKAKEGAKQT